MDRCLLVHLLSLSVLSSRIYLSIRFNLLIYRDNNIILYLEGIELSVLIMYSVCFVQWDAFRGSNGERDCTDWGNAPK